MSKKIILWLVVSIITISSFAFEQEQFIAQYGDREVAEITINGLRRTTEKTLLYWLETGPNNMVSEYDVANIYKRIEDKGIFALEKNVEFFPTDTEAIMIITVAEKFSLFAVPFFSSTDGDNMYGGAALDSNFWGYGSTLLAVGAFSKKDITTFVLLKQDEMLHNEYAGKIMINYRTFEIEMTDIFENPSYYASKQRTITLGGSIGKKFLDKKLTIGPDLEWQKITKDDEEAGDLIKDANFIFPGLMLEYDNTRQNFVFRDGFKAESLTSSIISLDDNYDDFFRSSTKLSYSQTHNSKVNLALKGNFGLFDRPAIAEEGLSASYGTKSLPNNSVYADDWINGALVLEHTLISKHKLNPTLSYYYEGGYYNNDGLNEKYHGVGSEIKVYFDKVAIPAIGIGVAYNFTTENTIMTFSFGMGGE